jgi:hypothetical protein
MTSPLENLVKIGQLKHEAPAQAELDGLVRLGSAKLKDATNSTLSLEGGRFDLAYNAAHALALAALRFRGYRADSRYLVFQVLTHTLGLATEKRRVLDKAHQHRNRSEYEGYVDVDEAVVESLIRVTTELEALVKARGVTGGVTA